MIPSISEHDLNALGEEFSDRLRAGQHPSIAEFTQRFSEECREEIQDFLESIAMIESMKEKPKATSKPTEVFPRDFGRYKIESSLGEGGMGTVYLAHDSQLDRKVALKTPKFDETSDPNLMARFHREAKSAATLRHPNICPVYDVGQINDIHYISMAYIEGRPLSAYVQSGKVPSVSSAIRIVRKVALALHEAHINGLIHRDLKPANIMIDGRNEPIVMDFGLARQFGDPNISHPSVPVLPNSSQQQPSTFQPRLTQEGTVLGSPGYMSPEQLRGEHANVGPVSDVYALGALFYELLTGQLPFPGDGSLMSIINAVLTDDRPDPAALRSAVDRQTADVCRQALAKQPKDRFQSMQTFAVALTGLLKSKETASQERHSKEQHGDERHGDERHSDDVSVKDVSPELIRIKEQYELSKSLYHDGQYAASVSIMEKMVETAGQPNQFTTWAEKQLPKAQAKARDTSRHSTVLKESTLHEDTWAEDRLTFSDEGDEFWDFDSVGINERQPERTSRRMPTASRKQRQPVGTKVALVVLCCAVIVMLGILVIGHFRKPNRVASEFAFDGAADQHVVRNSVDGPLGQPPPPPGHQPDRHRPDERPPGHEPSGDQPPNRRGRQAFLERIWKLDINEDERLSLYELGRIKSLQDGPIGQLSDQFRKFDQDPKDGLLDDQELQKLVRSLPRAMKSNETGPDRNRTDQNGRPRRRLQP